MDEKKCKEIYAKILENSVGIEKKCILKKSKKTITKKIVLFPLLLTLTASCLVGCKEEISIKDDGYVEYPIIEEKIEDTNNENDIEHEIIKEQEFSYTQIFIFGKARVIELLEKYNYTDFSLDYNKRHYNYTSEDYKKIPELDESYLYGFYVIATRETLNEVCKALGYSDIETYLISKGYVDEKGEPNVSVWYQKYVQDIVEIMREEKEKLNKGAR